MPRAGRGQGRRARAVWSAARPHSAHPPEPPGYCPNGVGVLVKLHRGHCRYVGGPAGSCEGDGGHPYREGPEAVWLRVGDVAAVLGVSANTVRRWTDVGRIAAHRSPGGHRRYLADDVLALLPSEAKATAPPTRATSRSCADRPRTCAPSLQAGLDLMSLLADDPHEVPARGGARAVRPHRRAALRRVLADGETPAARRLRGGRRAGHGPPGSRLGDARVGARRGRPRGRRPSPACARRDGPGSRAARDRRCSAAAAARSPGRRWCCTASSSAPSSSATPAIATSRATRTRSRAWRGICAEATADPAHHATSSRTATRPCASWSTSPARWRRPTTSSASSCASRSGCSPPPTPTAWTCGASAAA